MTSQPGEEYVPIRREHLDALLGLLGDHEHDERIRQASYRQGQADATHGYQTGFNLGHDTGLSARQDTRGYVHGILDGWDAGCDARHRLVEELTRRDVARHRPAAEAARRAGAQAKPEPELEAGG